MHQSPSQNGWYTVYERLYTPDAVHTKEIPKEILHNEMIMMPEGKLSNGRLLALTLYSKRSLHRKVVALEMPAVPGSDLSVNPTRT